MPAHPRTRHGAGSRVQQPQFSVLIPERYIYGNRQTGRPIEQEDKAWPGSARMPTLYQKALILGVGLDLRSMRGKLAVNRMGELGTIKPYRSSCFRTIILTTGPLLHAVFSRSSSQPLQALRHELRCSWTPLTTESLPRQAIKTRQVLRARM